MTDDMKTALATAVTQWHQAMRTHELAARALADAETQLALAQRDLHELARVIETLTGTPLAQAAAEANIDTPPIATNPAAPTLGPQPADGVDAASIVLQEMQHLARFLP